MNSLNFKLFTYP